MTAPEIQNALFFLHNGERSFTSDTVDIFNDTFEVLHDLTPTTKNDRNIWELWIQAPRGTSADFSELDLYDSEVDAEDIDRENKSLIETYPEEIVWFKLTAVEDSDGFSGLSLNGNTFYISSEQNTQDAFAVKAEDFAFWIYKQVKYVALLIKNDKYKEYLERLPKRYLYGKIPRKRLYELNPEIKKEMRISGDLYDGEPLSAEEIGLLNEKDVKPTSFEHLSRRKYCEICKVVFSALYSRSDRFRRFDESESEDVLKVYEKYADNRDGGFSMLPPDDEAAFDDWYDIPYQDKWDIGNGTNPSHMWEIIEGSSRTRIHLFVHKDNEHYYLSLSGCERCIPWEVAKAYVALRKAGINVYLHDADVYRSMFNEKDYIGVSPDYAPSWDHLYNSHDEKVFEYVEYKDVANFENEIEWVLPESGIEYILVPEPLIPESEDSDSDEVEE